MKTTAATPNWPSDATRLDWMMALPRALEERVWQDIARLEEEQGMAFITSVERIGIEKGIEKGIAKGATNVLVPLLTARFGPLPAGTVERIRAGTEADHACWAERLLTAPSLDAVFGDEPPAAH